MHDHSCSVSVHHFIATPYSFYQLTIKAVEATFPISKVVQELSLEILPVGKIDLASPTFQIFLEISCVTAALP